MLMLVEMVFLFIIFSYKLHTPIDRAIYCASFVILNLIKKVFDMGIQFYHFFVLSIEKILLYEYLGKHLFNSL